MPMTTPNSGVRSEAGRTPSRRSAPISTLGAVPLVGVSSSTTYMVPHHVSQHRVPHQAVVIQSIPTAALAALMSLLLVFSAVVTVLSIITLVMPNMYTVENQRPIAAPAAWVLREPGNLSRVIVVPDFVASVGIISVCYDTVCTSRQERTTRPVPQSTLQMLRRGDLLVNVTTAVLQLTAGGPLDFSIQRGVVSCESTVSASKLLRGLIIAAFCVAAAASVGISVPVVVTVQRFKTLGRIVEAVRTANFESMLITRESLSALRKAPQKEIRTVQTIILLSFLSCAAMIAAVVLFGHWENDVNHCHARNACSDITSGLREFARKILGDSFDPTTLAVSCGPAAGSVTMWSALVSSVVQLLLSLAVMAMYWCGGRRPHLHHVHDRIELMLVQESQRTAAQPALAVSPETDKTADARKRSPSRELFSPRDVPEQQRHSDALAAELSHLLSTKAQVMEDDERCARLSVVRLEYASFYALALTKRKVWRSTRVVDLHDWSLQWYFGPLLDFHVEETYYRQEIIRKWYSKVLDRCVTFSQQARNIAHDLDVSGGVVVPETLVCAFDEALSWASFYQPSRVGLPSAEPTSPLSALRGIPYFEQEWLRIIDSHSRRYDHGRTGGGREHSVEVSSDTSDDDAADSVLRRAARGGYGTPSRANQPKHRDASSTVANQSLLDGRALYPTITSPRGIVPHSWRQSDLRRSPPRWNSDAHSRRVDFKTLERDNDAVRKAYEQAILRSSSRPHFSHGFNAAADAARDFQQSVSAGELAARGASAPSGRRPHDMPVPVTAPAIVWGDAPTRSWGEGAVADRLAQLSLISSEVSQHLATSPAPTQSKPGTSPPTSAIAELSSQSDVSREEETPASPQT